MKNISFGEQYKVIKAYKNGTKKTFNEQEQRIIEAYKYRISKPVKPLTKSEKAYMELLYMDNLFAEKQHLKIENSLKDGKIYWTMTLFDKTVKGFDHHKCIKKLLEENEYGKQEQKWLDGKIPEPAKPRFKPSDYEAVEI